MMGAVDEKVGQPGIAFVGCCLPRPCGIATFTYDLAEAAANEPGRNDPVHIVAMNDRPEGYSYPDRVRFTVRADRPQDFARAAQWLNEHASVVCLQHEFGIFGGASGENVRQLVRRLTKPLVVTCHTVPTYPDPGQRDVFREIVARADRLVVMNRFAIDFMQALYGARYDRIRYIEHGVHDMPLKPVPVEKKAFGVEGPVLLTFGLLHREKGIEHMIDAMAAVVRERPDVTYVVAGATHPRVVATEGEAYRTELRAQIERLGLERNVVFIDRFADLSDLLGYLEETDIFVAPYVDLTRTTSGALSYAAGAGKAIVATPFLHARELLSDGRGRLVPQRNPRALARVVLEMLDDPGAMEKMRQRVHARARRMIWPAIARQYLALFDSVRAGRAAAPQARAQRAERAARALRALRASRGPSRPSGPTVRRAPTARRRDARSFGGF